MRGEDVELTFFDELTPMKVPRMQVESMEASLGGLTTRLAGTGEAPYAA